MSSFELQTCDVEAFVAEVTAQAGSLQEAASTQEILSQQIEAYLNRLRAAICADLENVVANCCSGGGGSFLGLSDTPGSYAGAAGEVVAVNAGETDLEFTPGGGGGGLPDLEDGVEVASGRQVEGPGGLEDSYFKLVDIGALPNATSKNVAHGITRPFTPITFWGASSDTSGPFTIPLPFVNGGLLTAQVTVLIDGANININTHAIDRTGFTDSYVILEYVKS